MNVIFVRGLNSYGDEKFHLGPLTFGRVDRYLRPYIEKLGHRFFSLDGIGCGSLDQQLRNAKEQLTRLIQAQELESFHMIGHSQGGILARALAHGKWQKKFTHITSIGTPHFGTNMAEYTLNLPKNAPLTFHTFRLLGYDTKKRQDNFRQLTREQMLKFNQHYPDIQTIYYQSVYAQTPTSLLNPPLWYLRFQALRETKENDGMIETTSQKWSPNQMATSLDHFAQLGFFFQPQKKIREQLQNEFFQLYKKILQIQT